MRQFNLYRNSALRRVVTGTLMLGIASNAPANPHGMTVQHGTATATAAGSQLTITASQNAFLNWQSFNIAAGETTIFQQPSAGSIVWNRINDQNPSQIFGSLQANGVVVLLNSSGFYFGPNSFVSAAGLVVSTANCRPPQNSGGAWEFNGPPPLASIVNYGQIKIGSGGSAFLIADKIENHGSIEAPGGAIGLAAGQTVLLSERPDGRGLSMKVKLPSGSVDNEGRLIADGGAIAMKANVVNQNGFLQADSVRNQNGIIELTASDELDLGANSQIIASGDNSSSGSAGGNVTLKSGNTFSDSVGSRIVVTGGAQGGNGGNVEISAPHVRSLNSSINARAQAGWMAGKLLLDPDYIILDMSGSGSADSGTVLAGDNPPGTTTASDGTTTLDLNVNSAFANLAVSTIILQAVYDITIADSTLWSLSDTIGANLGGVPGGQLTLQAGRNIIFGSSAAIYDANSWSVTLQAGVNDFAAGTVQTGKGSIYLGGFDGTVALGNSGSIQTANGAITLLAGQDIQVGSGSITTIGSGSITATAVAGSVNTGTDTGAFTFNNEGHLYTVDTSFPGGLGGISTAAGGDVNITAGKDIISYLPGGSINQGNTTPDAGSGAFGPGQVTLVAGGNVVGHYVLANGTGAIYAGVEMDANGNPVKDAGGHYVLNSSFAGSAGTVDNNLALSLINGNWTVQAANDIVLQEVRNPNGIFNEAGKSSHLFDYAAGDAVTLNARNSVQLLGNNVPRNSDETAIPIIYPSILNISAGAGGVILGADVILFPSKQGSLSVTTTGGGPFESQAYLAYLANLADYNQLSAAEQLLSSPLPFPNEAQLIMSDSARTRYIPNVDAFGVSDHAATPVHFNDPTTVALNISGDMNNVNLTVPEAAEINVVGNMNNSGFTGQNLHPGDVTSINVGQKAKANMEAGGLLDPGTDAGLKVGGDILNQSAYTSVHVASLADLSQLVFAYMNGSSVDLSDLASRLQYDPKTEMLTFQGQMTSTYEKYLTSLNIWNVDKDGNRLYQSDGVTPLTHTVSFLDPVTAHQLYVESLTAPAGQNPGYFIGGGGTFTINARDVNLGSTLGIQSIGPLKNGALATVCHFTQGADINLKLSGNLDIFSTTVCALNGGNISVTADGYVNIGSTSFVGNDQYVRGLFTVGPGDVSVIAGGDVNVNGSRIAAYDGGSVTVRSLHGNVDAGNGGTGSVGVEEIYVDPVTYQVYTFSPTIPLSGILAMTFPPRASYFPAPAYSLGNILIETPEGNITATAGGIVQLPLGSSDAPAATVTLLAGEDAAGNIISSGRNINISGSGVIGSSVTLRASGDIIGTIFARNNLDIVAVQNVSVTALAIGKANISGSSLGPSIIIGVGGIDASGDSSGASLLSNNQISGDTGGSKALAQGTAANATSQGMASEDAAKDVATTDSTDDDLKKKGKGPALAQKTGRVTVILPPKQQSSQAQTPDPRT